MEIFDKRTASILSTILSFVAAGAFIYFAARVLILFILAVLFAYVLEPLVSRFQHWFQVSRGSRSIAILEVYTLLIAAIGGVGFVIGTKIVSEAEGLIT